MGWRGALGSPDRAAAILLALSLAALATVARAGGYYDLDLPITRFADLAEAARRESLPILLVVTGPECGYCKRQRAEVLEPLGRAGWFDKRALVREYDWKQSAKVEDFDGTPARGGVFIDRYKVFATPTLLFLGPDGELLAPSIAGYNSKEQFAALLDESLTASRAALMTSGASAAR